MPLSTIITDIKQTEAAAATAGCESVDFLLNHGITQMYDPAPAPSITKLLNYFNFERDNNKKPVEFNITIDGEPLIECSLTYNQGSRPDEKTIILCTLYVSHYFRQSRESEFFLGRSRVRLHFFDDGAMS